MMPPTCGSAAGRGPPNGFCAISDVHGGVEDDDGRERRGRQGDASRETCGHPPHGQSTMILLANIAP